jgi:hypothetical protein
MNLTFEPQKQLLEIRTQLIRELSENIVCTYNTKKYTLHMYTYITLPLVGESWRSKVQMTQKKSIICDHQSAFIRPIMYARRRKKELKRKEEE